MSIANARELTDQSRLGRSRRSSVEQRSHSLIKNSTEEIKQVLGGSKQERNSTFGCEWIKYWKAQDRNPYDEQTSAIEMKYDRLKPKKFFNVGGVSHYSCSS